MKKSPPTEDRRFSGNLRHYHRGSPQLLRSWDEWVDGTPNKRTTMKRWPKILGCIVAALLLVGIVTGLIVELS
jgi:hypothetical protein